MAEHAQAHLVCSRETCEADRAEVLTNTSPSTYTSSLGWWHYAIDKAMCFFALDYMLLHRHICRQNMVDKQPHVTDVENKAGMLRKACMCDSEEGVSCEAAARALDESLMVLHHL